MDRFGYLKTQADPAFDRLARAGEGNLGQLSVRDQTVITVWALIGEVGNGGLSQFYYNSSGDWAFETVDALQRIGATEAAEIVRMTNSDFPPGGPSADFEIRHRQIEALPDGEELAEKWDRAGTRLCEMEQIIEEKLYQHLVAYTV